MTTPAEDASELARRAVVAVKQNKTDEGLALALAAVAALLPEAIYVARELTNQLDEKGRDLNQLVRLLGER